MPASSSLKRRGALKLWRPSQAKKISLPWTIGQPLSRPQRRPQGVTKPQHRARIQVVLTLSSTKLRNMRVSKGLAPSLYSVVGFFETVWLIETLIRKLLQILLDPVVIIFRSTYIHVRDAGQKSCASYFNDARRPPVSSFHVSQTYAAHCTITHLYHISRALSHTC